MLVRLIDTLAVSDADQVVGDAALGGRRARILLAALALDGGAVPAQRLAELVWGDALPSTWQVALRGVVRGLRTALRPIGGDDQAVIRTVPTGYRIGADVEIDIVLARETLRRAGEHPVAERARSVLEAVEPLTRLAGERLLPGDEDAWLAPHRAAVDELALRAAELAVAAAAQLGEVHRAVEFAREAVTRRPLDERAHRLLIVALDRAGDRAGAARAYESCRAALADELGVDPSSETVGVYLAAIQGGETTIAARPPLVTSSFLGREREVAELAAELEHAGLVTVTGRGGVGKSRLALQVIAASEPPGGRSWVSLSAVAEDELVETAVALALGVEVGAGAAGAELVRRLAPLGRALLVLDGCEAVIDGAASLAATLTAGCPALTVVVTSRVRLGVDGERVVELGPLPEPTSEDAAAFGENPQVRILLERVRADGGSLDIGPSTAALIAALCRRCGGLPLALELAAAQLTEMAVGDLLDQLDAVDPAPDDHLRAITQSSYALLDAEEAEVFRRIAVLDGAVTLQTVRAILAGTDIAAVRVVRIMRELGARGLVVVDRTGPRWRYEQDDDVHRFGRDLLVDAGEEVAAYDRLADAVRALLPDDAATPPAGFADAVTDVLPSVRSLLGAGLAGRADIDRCLELVFRLHRYWAATSVAEGRFWLSRLLAASDQASPWRRYATYALGYLSYWASATDDALRDLRAAIVLFDGTADPFLARAFIYVAGLLDDMDRPAEALDQVHRAIAAAEPFGTDLYVAAAMGIGSVLSERGDPAAAGYAAEAVARCRVDGSADQLSVLLPTAAMICWQVGDLAGARAWIEEARPMHPAGRRRIARVVLLAVSAGVALADGDVAGAQDFAAVADEEAGELGVERELALIRCIRARALLAGGDVAGAADRALAALDVAAASAVAYPGAVCLETAALVARAAGGAPPGDLAALLVAAAAIRSAGDRPAPHSMRAAVVDLAAALGTEVSGAAAGAPIALARRVLTPALTSVG